MADLDVEQGFVPERTTLTFSILLGLALLVGLGATGIILSLAAVESRPDMATLGAVGAPPRMRRTLACAQAGFTTGLGVTMGAALGIGFAWVLIVTFSAETQGLASQSWRLLVPWGPVTAIIVAVPLVATLGAYLLTRSQLPMTRRLAS